MKTKITFTEEQLVSLIQNTVKEKFNMFNLKFGKPSINLEYRTHGHMDREGYQAFKNMEIEVEFSDKEKTYEIYEAERPE